MKASEVEFVREKWTQVLGSGKEVTIVRSSVGDMKFQMACGNGNGSEEQAYYFLESKLKLAMRIAGEFDDDEE